MRCSQQPRWVANKRKKQNFKEKVGTPFLFQQQIDYSLSKFLIETSTSFAYSLNFSVLYFTVLESWREESERKRSETTEDFDVEALEEVKRELEKLRKVKEVAKFEEVKEVEENIYFPSHYSPSGCPTVPLVFSGMTGR